MALRDGALGNALSGRPTARAAAAIIWIVGAAAQAQEGAPGPHLDEQFDFMNLLSSHGLHDLGHETWNVYGQSTGIISWKPAFPARYTNLNGSPNSLLPDPELSYTGTFTVYLGVELWPGAQGYFVPEVIAEQPLSQLRGLGGAIQNTELQKGGIPTPQLYRARAYLKQTFGLGGDKEKKSSDPMQLGTVVDRRRIAVSAGNFSVLDFFDKNPFGIDPRQSFFSMAFLTYAAYDFAADARGYSWGAVAELFWDDWAIRVARVTPPALPNQLPVDFRLALHHGDQIEIEHQHMWSGRKGIVRLLGYWNQEEIGSFRGATAAFEADPGRNAASCPGFSYGSPNASAPDLCWARGEAVKVGIGMVVEQQLANDFGAFVRGMISDGRTEVDAYTSADRSLAFGLLGKGELWGRPADVSGVGLGVAWISGPHAEYLALGGIDGFIGDGAIRAAPEWTLDLFYSVNALSWLWLSLDYQHIRNPAFNADRGPVNVLGARVHAEF